MKGGGFFQLNTQNFKKEVNIAQLESLPET